MCIEVIVYVECWATGGIESFLKNLLKHLPRKIVHVTIFAVWGSFDKDIVELERLGADCLSVFGEKDPGLLKRTVEGPRRFESILRRRHFDVAHINTMNGMGLRYCAIARKSGISKVIAHSHNSDVGERMRGIKIPLHVFGRLAFGGAPTVRLACGDKAGRFLFGGKSFRIIKNGIDTDRFTFSAEKRAMTRKSLGLDRNAVVVGFIGRVVREKNPLFSIEVFNELHATEPQARFLLVGSGSLDSEVDLLVAKLGLSDFVIRIPSTPHVDSYYSALDAFLLPSSFEGIPFALIEAQCAGLPILASANVSREVAVTDLLQRLPLTESPRKWAEELYGLVEAREPCERSAYAAQVRSAGYDVEDTSRTVAGIYRGETAGDCR